MLPARHPQSLPSAAPVLAQDKALSLHPWVPGHGRVPNCSPQNAAYKSQQVSGCGAPSQGQLRGGRTGSLGPPSSPGAGGRQWEELVKRTLTETLFSQS